MDVAGNAAQVDWINLMTYDFNGAWNAQGPTDFQSNLYADPASPNYAAQPDFCVSCAVASFISKGAPKAKLHVGVPFYGRGWTGVDNVNSGVYQPATGPAAGASEAGIQNYNLLAGNTAILHAATQQTYSFDGSTWWSFDSPAVVALKSQWVKSMGLGGMFAWSADGDSGAVLTAAMAAAPSTPTTLAPTHKPATSAPTHKPTTAKPTATLAPVTVQPTTASPSQKPTTAAPSKRPTTQKPTKKAPTTKAPVTTKPLTQAPTKKPTSAKPTTHSPSSSAQTTQAPATSLRPTTHSPSQTASPASFPAIPPLLSITANISVYVPWQHCAPENCPPDLGTCDAQTNTCVFMSGYEGLATLKEAYATEYCSLTADGCLGVTYINTPHTTATYIGGNFSMPLCQEMGSPQTCVGIFASPSRMNGNAQTATYANGTAVKNWGMGLTEASGVCYQLTGPTGHVVLVAQTDRCGGYCTCSAQSSMAECGPCVNDAELVPNCPCVGTVPGVYSQCCGLAAYGCPSTQQECDWCASQNHPHFDLDIATFNYLCDSDSGDGSCVRRCPALADSGTHTDGRGRNSPRRSRSSACSRWRGLLAAAAVEATARSACRARALIARRAATTRRISRRRARGAAATGVSSPTRPGAAATDHMHVCTSSDSTIYIFGVFSVPGGRVGLM